MNMKWWKSYSIFQSYVYTDMYAPNDEKPRVSKDTCTDLV